MVSKVLKLKLSNGNEMPVVGLGTYARKANPGQYGQAVEIAINAGYRHIDTASCYNNEEEVGQAINNKIREGAVTRDELFVTTKLWNDSHAQGDVIPALKHSLARLQLEYVDLYLIHWPVSVNLIVPWEKNIPKDLIIKLNKYYVLTNELTRNGYVVNLYAVEVGARGIPAKFLYNSLKDLGLSRTAANGVDTGIDYIETWKGMEQAMKQGLTKAIGVSNFNEEQLERLLSNCSVKPVCNQFEINPTLTQHKLVEFCKERSVLAVAYTPLGLISEARPEFIGKDVIKTDPRLGEVADKHGKTRAQVALRYLIQRGIPVLPKSFTKSRIEENIDLFDFELSEEDMRIVESFNIDHRCVPGTAFKSLKYYPYA